MESENEIKKICEIAARLAENKIPDKNSPDYEIIIDEIALCASESNEKKNGARIEDSESVRKKLCRVMKEFRNEFEEKTEGICIEEETAELAFAVKNNDLKKSEKNLGTADAAAFYLLDMSEKLGNGEKRDMLLRGIFPVTHREKIPSDCIFDEETVRKTVTVIENREKSDFSDVFEKLLELSGVKNKKEYENEFIYLMKELFYDHAKRRICAKEAERKAAAAAEKACRRYKRLKSETDKPLAKSPPNLLAAKTNPFASGNFSYDDEFGKKMAEICAAEKKMAEALENLAREISLGGKIIKNTVTGGRYGEGEENFTRKIKNPFRAGLAYIIFGAGDSDMKILSGLMSGVMNGIYFNLPWRDEEPAGEVGEYGFYREIYLKTGLMLPRFCREDVSGLRGMEFSAREKMMTESIFGLIEKAKKEKQAVNEKNMPGQPCAEELVILKNMLADAERTAEKEKKKREEAEKKLETYIEKEKQRVLNASNAKNEREKQQKQQTVNFPYRPDKKIVVFGGHDSWLREIKKLVEGVKFVRPETKTDPEIIKNADEVWIQSNAIPHMQYDRILDVARTAGKQVKYFTSAGALNCARQLVESNIKNISFSSNP